MNFFEKKQILVAGATGLIGSNLIERLMNMNDVKVIALGRNELRMRELFAKYHANPRFSFLIQDALQPIPKLKEHVDIIINAVGSATGSEIINSPFSIIEANLFSTLNFLNFLRNQNENCVTKGKLIILSSATVYSSNIEFDKRLCEEETEITNQINEKNAPYSETKRFIEVLGNSYYKQYGVECITVRPSYIYGFSFYNANTAFNQFVEQSIKGKNIVIQSLALPRRDNIYIEDLINGLLCVCEYGVPGEVYNISSNGEQGNFIAINEIAEIVAKVVNGLMDSHVEVEYSKGEVCLCSGLLLDNNKLKMLGWNLRSSIIDGVSEAVKKYLHKYYSSRTIRKIVCESQKQ